MKFLFVALSMLAVGALDGRAESTAVPQRPSAAWHGHAGAWWPRYGGWRGPGYGYIYTCYAESGYGQVFGAYSADPYYAQNLALQACYYSSGWAGCVALGCR